MIGAITGVLSSRSVVDLEYFTTVLYPFAVNDGLSITTPAFSADGSLWSVPTDTASITNPTILSGSLVSSIVYQTYTFEEDMSLSNPVILSGSLNTTIVYQTYTFEEDMSLSNPVILSGSLNTTIVYINYTDGLIENTQIYNPIILSGSLT
jgi:hypothetical protein